jgi:O-antigen/teichoic acid export membrane protein
MIDRKKFLGASAINGAGFIVVSILNVLWYFLIINQYDRTASGLLLVGISIAGLVNLLDLGVSLGLINAMAQATGSVARSPWKRYLAATICICLMEVLAGMAAVVLWRHMGAENLPLAVLGAVIVFAVSTQGLLLSASALKGQLRFKEANLVVMVSAIATYGLGTAMAACRADIWHMFYAMTAAQLAVAGLAVHYCHTVLRKVPASTGAEPGMLVLYRELLGTSLRFFPQSFAGIVFTHAQRLAIAKVIGVDSVAILSFAYSVASRAHAVVNAFLEVLFPMARSISASTTNLTRFCMKAGLIAFLIYAAAIACALVIVARFAPPATWYLFLYSIGVSFSIAAAPAFHILNGSGKSASVSSYSLAGPAIFVATLFVGSRAIQVTTDLVPIAYAAAMLAVLALTWFGMRGIAPVTAPNES